jgi:diketogulonate reductase-like aldo/keto reductase
MNPAPHSTLPLAPGVDLPWLGLGVYKMEANAEGESAIRTALDLGYRHIDTASVYANEEAVGRALAASGLPRRDVFLTTKVWLKEMGPEATPRALEQSLRKLRTDYVDLYLIHWPDDSLLPGCWEAMRTLRDRGLARAIGVCNFSPRRLEFFDGFCGEQPAANQFELHPFLPRPDWRAACAARGITPVSFSPLARAQRFSHPVIQNIARAHARTPAQVHLRWCLQQGLPVIPKSSHPDRLKENAAIFDFALSPGDLDALAQAALDSPLETTTWRPDPAAWY